MIMETMKLVNLSINWHARAFVWGVLSVASLALSTGVRAQEGTANAGVMQQLQGFYQFPNKVAFVEFEWKDGTLYANQLWDNTTYQLIQLDGLNFETKDEGHQIGFIKDESGQVNQAKLQGRIVTTKVDFDPRKVAPLTADQLSRLEGTYQSKGDQNLKLAIRSAGKELVLKQLWDQTEVVFEPRSATFFLDEDGTFPLSFVMENGDVTQVICFESDAWLKEQE